MDPVRRKQRIPAQTENERGENGENLVAGERFRKDVKTAETLWIQGEKENPSTQRITLERRVFTIKMVEAAGVEPASANAPLSYLHV